MVIVGVKIGDSREILYFNAGKLRLKKNLTIIVDTLRGLEFGTVVKDPFEDNNNVKLNKVIRVASKDDYLKFKDSYNNKIINILKSDDDKNKVFITCDDKNINEVISELSDYEIKEFNNIKETLEDYFMKFYKEDKEFGGNF